MRVPTCCPSVSSCYKLAYTTVGNEARHGGLSRARYSAAGKGARKKTTTCRERVKNAMIISIFGRTAGVAFSPPALFRI